MSDYSEKTSAELRSPESRNRSRKKGKRQLRKILVVSAIVLLLTALLISMLLLFRSLFGNRKLYGTWDLDGTTVYHFEKNGEGTLEVPNGQYAFHYTARKGILRIDFIDSKLRDSVYSYQCTRKTLILESGGDIVHPDYVFTRVNEKNGR